MKITVLSPHRDDAAFSIGLAIETWLDARHRVEVINCFSESEYGPFGNQDFGQAEDRKAYVTAIRHQEDIRWTKSYVHPVDVVDLKFLDAPVRLSCRISEVCTRAVAAEPVVMMIRNELEKRALDSLVLPLAIGRHVDHLIARMAAQDGWPSSLPMAFYEDLPYAARPGAAKGIKALANSIAHELRASFVSGKTDVNAAEERKRCLALCYDSQIDQAVAEQIAGFCRRHGGRERLWVNRAWLDAEMGILS